MLLRGILLSGCRSVLSLNAPYLTSSTHFVITLSAIYSPKQQISFTRRLFRTLNAELYVPFEKKASIGRYTKSGCRLKEKMRRKAGVGAIHKQKLEQEKYKDKGTEIQESQLELMTKRMETFRTNLEDFASKHKNEIRKNAQFRRQFTEMCASIGVDPLASGKGFWSVLGIGEFYYQLAVQIVEVCMSTNYKTGGLISLDELRQRLVQARGKRKEHQEITNEDLLAASKKLRIFGNGFSVVAVGGGRHLVQSVPGELSMDHTAVLQQASLAGNACASVSLMEEKLHWERDRGRKALEHMVKMGLAWLDEQSEEETLYWFPSLFTACIDSSS